MAVHAATVCVAVSVKLHCTFCDIPSTPLALIDHHCARLCSVHVLTGTFLCATCLATLLLFFVIENEIFNERFRYCSRALELQSWSRAEAQQRLELSLSSAPVVRAFRRGLAVAVHFAGLFRAEQLEPSLGHTGQAEPQRASPQRRLASRSSLRW